MGWEQLIQTITGAAYVGDSTYPSDNRPALEADKDAVAYFSELTDQFFGEYQRDVVGLLTNREEELTAEQQVAARFLRDFTLVQAWERYTLRTPGQSKIMGEKLKAIEETTENQEFPVGGWGKGPLQRVASTLAPAVVAYIVTYNNNRADLAHHIHGLFQQMKSNYHSRTI